MNKIDLLNMSYPNDNEKILNLRLREKYQEYGYEKTFKSLSYTNQLLLASCGIDENSFNYILLKNYIFFLYSNNTNILNDLSNEDKEIINNFNQCILNNNLEGALNLLMNNYVIHQLLCLVYINNLSKTEIEKVNVIQDELVDEVFVKINLLKENNLSFESIANKKYSKSL